MKIGIIGNMNNMYYSLARYLIDLGYDCEVLIYNNEPAHFHPSCDTITSDYKKYCKVLSWGDPAQFLKLDFNKVASDLAPYDFLIGSGPAPAFVSRIGRKLDLFIPYGDDLYSLPFYRLVHPVRVPAYLTTAYHQRKGIRETPYLIFDKTIESFEVIFKKINYRGKRISSPPPLLYHNEYDFEKMELAIAENPFTEQLQYLRAENELLIFQPIRQLWKKKVDKWSNKGNEKLIYGLHLFLKQYPHTSIKLILLEYGDDVPATKKLIEILKLENNIAWFPKMPRKYIMQFVQQSDMIIGELFHSWLTYCVAIEALAMGIPLMHKRDDAELGLSSNELYPMIHADSAVQVSEGFIRLLQEREEVKGIGEKGKAWFMDYCVQQPLAVIEKIIQQKSNRSFEN